MSGWFDSHCHLDSVDDPGAAVGRAGAAGVEGMVSVGTDIASSRACAGLAMRFDSAWNEKTNARS